MPVESTMQFRHTVKETLPAADAPFASANLPITHDGLNVIKRIDADSDVPGTLVIADDVELSSGSATIDLASASHNGTTVDASGLKLQHITIANPAGNNPMTVEPGASNPYSLFGASGQVTLDGDSQLQMSFADTREDVDGTHKEIDITGTGTEKLNIIMVFG